MEATQINIDFEPDTHTYSLNGKELISVTTLLKKHGISKSYNGIDETMLQAKARRGTLVHKEIEEYIKLGSLGFTDELLSFMQIMEAEGLRCMQSERIVYNDELAGTIDLTCMTNKGTALIDFKTSAVLDRVGCQWQLSLYEYLSGKQFDRLIVYHFTSGRTKIVELPRVKREEIEWLFECERRGVIYAPPKEQLPSELVLKLSNAEALVVDIESEYNAVKKERDALRLAMVNAMEENGVQCFENDNLKITYVAPYSKTTIDTAGLKRDLPEVAEKYAKTSLSKAGVRITMKV